MAVNGFVLITVKSGKELDVQKVLSEINELSERYTIHKEYDFLVIASAVDSVSLEQFVMDVIKPIPGITEIKTIFGIDVGSAAKLRNLKPVRKL